MAKTRTAAELAAQAITANKNLQDYKDSLTGIENVDRRRMILSDQIIQNQKALNKLLEDENFASAENQKIYKELLQIKGELKTEEEKINKEIRSGLKPRQMALDITRAMLDTTKQGWKYLMEQDKVIKGTILSLGMSGAKAAEMRGSFEESAGLVARMGGSLEDVQTIMQGYADETGRARSLSAEMVVDIEAIGKGTGLGVEQATKLGAQFELMGYDAKSTMEYVQGVVDTSERMGVNTTKVLKNVSDNFKKLNTYTFQQGVKGMAQMAMYAEKFKVDIGQALNAADVARSLEGAIDLAAQLQIMGGEFAKTDPFEMLFLSRNDPAKFTEKITEMTRGVVSFRKMADGSFEKFISPADRDRLAAVAKSLGMEVGELTQIAERQAEIDKMRTQMAGMGLSDEQKKLIEGAAIFNKETGKFEAKIGGHMRDIATLTETQAKSFAKESKSLKDRALEAQTFDEAFKATINELKSALLPMLQGVNKVLTAIRPVIVTMTEWMTKGPAAWAKVAGMFILGAGLLKGASIVANKAMENWISKSKVFNLFGGKGPNEEIGRGASYTKAGNIRKGAPELAKAQGLKSLGTGAGIGAAAVGMGAGVGLAAVGISKLADSMAKLDEKQVKALQVIAVTLAVTFPLAAIGIALAGGAATATAPGLLALGAAMLMIGGAVGIAAAGIGVMGAGLGMMFTAVKGAGPDMYIAATGVAAIAAAMGAATMTLPGGIGMAIALGSMAKHADKLVTVAPSVQKITAALKGSTEDFKPVVDAVKAISNMKVKGGGMFAELADLFKKPLRVEFADKNVAMVNDITLTLNGQKLFREVYKNPATIQTTAHAHVSAITGKPGNH
jgi:hypothetical protein